MIRVSLALVLTHVPGLPERHAAEVAGVGLLARVVPAVDGQVLLPGKLLAAELAHVGLDVQVGQPVLGQPVAGERLAAHLAAARPLPGVHKAVAAQLPLGPEGLGAAGLGAAVRLGVRVDQLVALEAGRLGEALAADVAHKGLLARVQPLVVLEARVLREAHAAHPAHVGLLARVDLLVQPEHLDVGVGLAARVAGVGLLPAVLPHVQLQGAGPQEHLVADLAPVFGGLFLVFVHFLPFRRLCRRRRWFVVDLIVLVQEASAATASRLGCCGFRF